VSEQEWFSKDFYKVLGVDKTADKKAITKAYRKLARQWHPDQNPGDKAAEAKFKEIGEAYAVLSNDEDRKRYDAIRAMASGGARFSAGSGGAGGFAHLDVDQSGPGTSHAPGDTPLRPGTSHACGDRNSAPDGVDCPRRVDSVPDRADRTHRCYGHQETGIGAVSLGVVGGYWTP